MYMAFKHRVLPSHKALIYMSVYFTPSHLLSVLFFSAITQYVSSAALKSGRCHFLQFIDGGS